ncbi:MULTISPECIES: histidinol-phosphate transaminase [Nocardiaceae]|uniref:Aromatic amino acid aminotransferase n=1 Tax=Rhodococcoides kroppenstedtii TaxID=293050 RepID=A0ABS7NVX2_9NOCA|nr:MULTISPECIES: histidinol-phosphate transaminase [Rhodococcus]AMY20963.1 Putative phenylalanine aminotransferase [Rhodococcus sp. PBTS 1]MBY6314079.1 histidinol-phosphate transaminase [Rhodococcus kroppenstedtii]MBY6321852.1 histidinol-phosphate transaminase [Rhodococcus kroppenstedtii]MBY6400860.1 histidinol-phosphate transaminase [Rhodococcus kroppenstedtii]
MTARTRPDLDAIPGYIPGRTVAGAIKLASNETTAGPLPSVRDAIADAVAGVNRYPDNAATALTDALADFLDVPSANVVVGCGSVSLCQELVQATCSAGDEVVFGWRSFEAYPIVTLVAGATAVRVPLTDDDVHDLDAMAAAVTDRTRLMFVCNPNNPTGTVVDPADLDRFLDTVPEHVLVVLDEAYFEYTDRRIDGVEVGRTRPNVMVLRTFSKAYGLAGLRVGYGVGAPSVVTAMKKVHTAFSVSSVAQSAAIASLAASDELLSRTEIVVAERARLRDGLREAGYQVADSFANFVWLPLGAASGTFSADATDARILVRAYGDDGVRVTVGDPHENDAFLDFAAAAATRYVATA